MNKKNLFYNTVLSVSQVIFPLIIFPYTFKVLEPEGTGLISFVENLTVYIISLAAIGIPIYGVREVAKSKNDHYSLAKLFTSLVFIQFIITIILTAVYIILIFKIDKLSDNKELYFISCAILFLNVFSLEWFFQGLERFKYVAIRTILIRFIFIILIFIFVRNREDVVIYYSITFLTTMLNSMINFQQALKFVKFNFRSLEIKRHIRPLLHIFITTLAINVYIVLDTVILGFLSDRDEVVGFYALAIKICKIPLALMSALSLVMIPQISTFFSSGNIDQVFNLVNKSFTYIVLLAIPISTGIFLLAPDLVYLLANENFAPAIPAVRMLSVLTLIIGLNNLFGMQILISMGKEKLTMYIVSIGMFISVFSNLLLVPVYSYIGTAVSTLVAELFVTIVTGWYAIRFIKIKFPLSVVGQSLFASLFFLPLYFLISYGFTNPLVKTSLMILGSSVIYFSILLFLFKNNFLKNIVNTMSIKLINKPGMID